jgi:hypothetical protein
VSSSRFRFLVDPDAAARAPAKTAAAMLTLFAFVFIGIAYFAFGLSWPIAGIVGLLAAGGATIALAPRRDVDRRQAPLVRRISSADTLDAALIAIGLAIATIGVLRGSVALASSGAPLVALGLILAVARRLVKR